MDAVAAAAIAIVSTPSRCTTVTALPSCGDCTARAADRWPKRPPARHRSVNTLTASPLPQRCVSPSWLQCAATAIASMVVHTASVCRVATTGSRDDDGGDVIHFDCQTTAPKKNAKDLERRQS